MTQWGLDTLFNPAKRHMDEEKRRLQSTREEIGDSSGGKRIDLESGAVTISRTGTDQPDDSDEPDEPEAATKSTTRSAKSGRASKQAAKERTETPAQERARARRQRRNRG